MKNNKLTLLPGLSLFFFFCLLTGTGRLAAYLGGGAPLIALAELISFVLPFFLVKMSIKEPKTLYKRLKYKQLPKGAIGLTVKAGITVAVLSLFLNLLIYQLAGLAGADLSATALDAPQTGLGYAARLLVIVALSAVVEELYLRGALMNVHEGMVGTSACLLFSGIAFAMLHGSLMNFAGPLLAGITYAYLTYIFDSVWPAILAHAVNNLYYMFVLWITDTYAAFGIWNYFAAVNGLVLLLFLYLSLRSLEKLLTKGSVPHFEKSAGLYDLWLLIRNPGVAAFALAFVAKLVLDQFI